MLAAFLR